MRTLTLARRGAALAPEPTLAERVARLEDAHRALLADLAHQSVALERRLATGAPTERKAA